MEIDSIDILELLPQRPPFVMVDNLIHCDPVVATTRFTVREDNIFCEQGALHEVGLVENIAQTCAARIGYTNRCMGESIKVGVIGAIRNLHIYRTPHVGESLQTTITVVEEVFQMTLVDAVVKSGDEVLVDAQMKIAVTDVDAN